MNRWDSTYSINRVCVSDTAAAEVWTALSDAGQIIGRLDIRTSSGNSWQSASIALTSEEMMEVAAILKIHADRLDELKHELDYLQTEAA